MGTRFTFGCIKDVKFDHLQRKETKELLAKWSMQDGLKVQAFYFDGKFKIYLLENFIQDFFGSNEVMGKLERVVEAGHAIPINIPAEVIQYQEVKATLTSVEIFDRLTSEDHKVVRPSGSIVKCLPDYIQPDAEIHDPAYPIEVGDQLRKLIISEYTSDLYAAEDLELRDVYSPEEKDEFLFRLFGHLVLGGSLCQYEDNAQPYIDTAKSIYKDLMTIKKVTASMGTEEEGSKEKLAIQSVVVKVNSVRNENYSKENLLFSNLHINNFLYVIVQPEEQSIYTLYHTVVG